MHYLIYKITNKKNGMFYIGAHKTKNKNDGYMGSGKNIRNAIEQDGLEHFQKEILYECSSTREMYKKERELVIVNPNISYNLKKGGDGGFDYIHRKLRFKGANAFRKKLKNDKKFRKTYSEKMQKIMLKKYSDGMINPFLGKKHTIKTKQTIGAITTKSQKGKRNSQFGTKWIYNKETLQNKKIKKTDPIPPGWVLGRKMCSHNTSNF